MAAFLAMLGLGCATEPAGVERLVSAATRAAGRPVIFSIQLTVGRYPLGPTTRTPIGVMVLDSASNAIPGLKITWAVDSGGGAIESIPNPDTSRTDLFVAATWRLGNSERRNIAHVEVPGLVSGGILVLGAPGRLSVVSGDSQSVRPGAPVANPVVVRALTTAGLPLGAGFPILFRPLDQSGAVKAEDTAWTDVGGVARQPVPWVAEPNPGWNTMIVTGETSHSTIRVYAEAVVPKPEKIVVVSGDNQRSPIGSFLPQRPLVTVIDSSGQPMPNQPIAVEVAGVGGATRSFPMQRTDGQGRARVPAWRLGLTAGTNQLRVSTPGLPPAPILFTASVDSLPTPAFSIETRFQGVFPVWIGLPLVRAVRSWERVIVGDLPDVTVALPADPNGCHPAINRTIDDVLVFVRVVTMDGPGNNFADARVCRSRTNGLPLISRILLDHDDLVALDESAGIEQSLLHMIGHALGFGNSWSQRPDLADHANLRFLGQSTVQAANWSRWSPGTSLLPWDFVPLGDGADPTSWTHWNDALAPDIMASTIGRTSAISIVTAAAFRELGYVVDDFGATELFTPAAGPPASGTGWWRVDGLRPAARHRVVALPQ